jgi:hypothetical protein
MTTPPIHLNRINEIFIIRNILEYADLGLELFYNDLKNFFFLKLNPQNKKFSPINSFFSQIHYLSTNSVIKIFNSYIVFASSELIVPNGITISYSEIKENKKGLMKKKIKKSYHDHTIEI